MKNLIVILCVFASYYANSQSLTPEAIFSASGNLSNNYAQISWTLGDTQTKTYSIDNLIITQGFLQSSLAITNVISLADNEKINLKVFPNPVSDILNIKYTAEKETKVSFYLYNLQGSLLFSKEVDAMNYTETISFNRFESGTYLLKAVSADKSYVKTFKILYQN